MLKRVNTFTNRNQDPDRWPSEVIIIPKFGIKNHIFYFVWHYKRRRMIMIIAGYSSQNNQGRSRYEDGSPQALFQKYSE